MYSLRSLVFWLFAVVLTISAHAEPFTSDSCENLLRQPISTQLHFQSQLNLHNQDTTIDPLVVLQRLLYSWTQSRDLGLSGQISFDDFQKTGHWESEKAAIMIRSHETAASLVWGFWSEHVDSGSSNVSWRMETLIEKPHDPNSPLQVINRVSWVPRGRAASQGIVFPPSVPRFIRQVINNPGWTVYTGDIPLRGDLPVLVTGESADLLKQLLKMKNRLPVVYVSKTMEGQWAADPHELSKVFLGQALVVADSLTSSHQTTAQYYLPERFRVWGGGVRVYLPGVDLENPSESAKHFFYTPYTVRSYDFIHALHRDLIANSMVLNSVTKSGFASVRDILVAERVALKQIIDQAGPDAGPETGFQKEYVQLLEEENALLTQRNLELQQSLDQIIQRNRSVEEKKSTTLSGPKPPSALPRNLSETLEYFQREYGDRLAFTERALRSAEDAEFQDPRIAWEILHSMATKLYELYSTGTEESLGQIAKDFQEATGYPLAVSESSLTGKTPRLSSIRQDNYKGRPIDISAHIKYGSKPPRILRVHFTYLRDEKKIVIGHFGDHLETAGTARRR